MPGNGEFRRCVAHGADSVGGLEDCMDERDWEILTTVAEERSISRAAERLFLSQPAISYRLRRIEDDFGAKIAYRTPSGVVLTPQGEHLVSYAREMQLSLKKTKERILSMSDKVCGPLRIGSSAIFANYELPELLRGFLERNPDVEIFLKTDKSRQIARMLDREEVSVAIVRGDYPWSEVRHQLREEPICLVSRTRISMAELPEKPRIIYGTDTSLQEMVDAWWRETFIKPSFVSMEVDTMDTCRRMVRQDLGWAVLSFAGLSEFDNLYTENLHWADGSPLLRRTWVYCHKASMELPAVRAFVEYLAQTCDARYAGQESRP